MTLHPTLDDILDDFIHEELTRLIHQAAELEVAMKLHQAQMKEVCHSIKARDHWVTYGEHFTFTIPCRFCGVLMSPDFDMRFHRGLCALWESRRIWRPTVGSLRSASAHSASNWRSICFHFSACLATAVCGTCSQK